MDGGLCARTLPLLPTIESKHPPKPNVPAGLLPAVGPPLSLAGGDVPPFESLSPGQDHMRAHQILTSRPVCTRPAAHVSRPKPGVLPIGYLSPVAATDLRHGACAALRSPPTSQRRSAAAVCRRVSLRPATSTAPRLRSSFSLRLCHSSVPRLGWLRLPRCRLSTSTWGLHLDRRSRRHPPPAPLGNSSPRWPTRPGAGGCFSVPPLQPPHPRCVRRDPPGLDGARLRA